MAPRVIQGDCREVLASLPADSVHSVLTDPPYHLTSTVKRFANAVAEREHYAMEQSHTAYMSRGFMGKTWDGGNVAFDPDTWRAVFRVMRPGGFLMAFGSTRTHHRLFCAIEDAGFEIRDTVAWITSQGFPKSRNVSADLVNLLPADTQCSCDRDYQPTPSPADGGSEHRLSSPKLLRRRTARVAGLFGGEVR